MNLGDRVKCLHGDIDNGKHAGKTGTIIGFARFSSYHPREARVEFDEIIQPVGWKASGHFWLSSLEAAS